MLFQRTDLKQTFMVKTIEWKNKKVILLDQSRLPFEVTYIECLDYHKVAEGIKKMWIRGAPAIGIAAAMGIALGAQDIKARGFEEFIKKLNPICKIMFETRPTAINIQWAIEKIKNLIYRNKFASIDVLKKLLIQEAKNILKEDILINKAIGRWGSSFIKDGDTILTHCNAGSLATGGYGTATAPMLIAKEQGKKFQVIANETRPVLQGARLTTWELMHAGIDVTLITDSSAGFLMKKGYINLAIVGTDRTTRNGDVANKIGTYTIAVMCKTHKIPFYVAAPLSSIDFKMKSCELIPIEQRSPDEVRRVLGQPISPPDVKVLNFAFDVTPSKYVSAFFTEKGAFLPKNIKKLLSETTNLDSIRLKA